MPSAGGIAACRIARTSTVQWLDQRSVKCRKLIMSEDVRKTG